MTGFRVRIATREEYGKVLRSWAAFTLSSPEPRWRGPGVYGNGGYMDDDGRPVATLEKVNA